MKYRYLVSAIILIAATTPCHASSSQQTCSSLEVIFARGSGEPLNGANSQTFQAAINTQLANVAVDYNFYELTYPAVSVDFADSSGRINALGAFFSGGESYAFGDSVEEGINMLISHIKSALATCPSQKFVLAGYSQGAMLISRALQKINSDAIIYAATFGDPKLYLPEGAGLLPAACSGRNLSEYRLYVPDCFAHKGLLGALEPYMPDSYTGKLGTWCNKKDLMCSSYYSLDDHISYYSNGLYDDAAKIIASKVAQAFGKKNKNVSSHDLVILIDSTGSMSEIIDDYKSEALKLSQKIFDRGGRVALYEYRDLADPFIPIMHCDFLTCDLETITEELDKITAENGGDEPESLLSASFSVMNSLTWKFGATKSLVVLTDAGFHSPDLDGTAFDAVVMLSKNIDPVNFYIITPPQNASLYADLAEATGGKIFSSIDELELSTEHISTAETPRTPYATMELIAQEKPEIFSINHQIENDLLTIEITSNAEKYLVAINDTILGETANTKLTITDLDYSTSNQITLIPYSSSGIRGESKEIIIPPHQLTLKVPDTGAK